MGNVTKYADEVPRRENDVVFIDNKSGKKLVREFDSPYLAHQFVNKVRHSKRVSLVSYPSKK